MGWDDTIIKVECLGIRLPQCSSCFCHLLGEQSWPISLRPFYTSVSISIISAYFIGLLWELNEVIYIKSLNRSGTSTQYYLIIFVVVVLKWW